MVVGSGLQNVRSSLLLSDKRNFLSRALRRVTQTAREVTDPCFDYMRLEVEEKRPRRGADVAHRRSLKIKFRQKDLRELQTKRPTLLRWRVTVWIMREESSGSIRWVEGVLERVLEGFRFYFVIRIPPNSREHNVVSIRGRRYRWYR